MSMIGEECGRCVIPFCAISVHDWGLTCGHAVELNFPGAPIRSRIRLTFRGEFAGVCDVNGLPQFALRKGHMPPPRRLRRLEPLVT